MLGAAIAVSRLYSAACSNCGNSIFPALFKQCISKNLSQTKLYQSTPGCQSFGSWRTFTSNNNLLSCRKNFCGRKNHSLQPFIRLNVFQIFKRSCTNPANINTNIKNNVMLYRYEKPYMYKVAIVFGVIAFIGCLAMADNVYLVLCKDLFDSAIDLQTRIKNHMLPLTAILIGVLAGPTILTLTWYATVRAVKYVVLHQGGKEVTFVTYHPIIGEKKFNVPVHYISADTARSEKNKPYVPVRVKHRKLRYVLDKSGHFVNPELFDATVGIKRF